MVFTPENFSGMDRRSYYNGKCGPDIWIVGCTFSNCYSSSINYGCSLFVQQETDVTLHQTIFSNSSTMCWKEGAVAIGKSLSELNVQ